MAKTIPATPTIPAAMPPTKAPLDTPDEGAAEAVFELAAPVALPDWLLLLIEGKL